MSDRLFSWPGKVLLWIFLPEKNDQVLDQCLVRLRDRTGLLMDEIVQTPVD